MTVKELKEILSKFDDNNQVKVFDEEYCRLLPVVDLGQCEYEKNTIVITYQ